MLKLEDLFGRGIDWQSTKNPQVLTAVIDGQSLCLRYNDFPVEALFTLMWDGGEINLDDRGPKWTLPEERERARRT